MSEENKKIVIVIGAGASCDFVGSDKSKYDYSFPLGEALIKKIGDTKEIEKTLSIILHIYKSLVSSIITNPLVSMNYWTQSR